MSASDLGYEELEQQLKQVPLTWLPGLLYTLVTECVRQKIFQEGGLVRAVIRAQQTAEAADGEPRVREDQDANAGD